MAQDDLHQIAITAAGVLLAAFGLVVTAGATALAFRLTRWGKKLPTARRKRAALVKAVNPPILPPASTNGDVDTQPKL